MFSARTLTLEKVALSKIVVAKVASFMIFIANAAIGTRISIAVYLIELSLA